MRLLLIENPDRASRLLRFNRVHNVDRVFSANEAVSLVRHDSYDLVLVNTASLDEEGFACLKRLRVAKKDIPLIALTRQGEILCALGLGVDDAVALPVDAGELHARITAVVRRRRGYAQSQLELGNGSLCLTARQVHVAGVRVALTDREYAVLELLVLQRGLCVSKDTILTQLYGGMDEPHAKIVDVFVCKLRKKLAHARATFSIGTIWGQGYALRTTVAA